MNSTLPLIKFPRTPHLPWSNASADDILSAGDFRIPGKIVVTEKLDGENTTIGRDCLYARSTDKYTRHTSRQVMSKIAAEIQHSLPPDIFIIGENLYATHSIRYTELPGYFVVFAVRNNVEFFSWEETEKIARRLNLPIAPVLYTGKYSEDEVKKCFTGRSMYGPEAEGYVVRYSGRISIGHYGKYAAKYVRPGHVKENSKHWRFTTVVANKLAESGNEN